MKSRTNKEHSKLVKAGLRKAREAGRIGGNPHIHDAQKQAIKAVMQGAETHAQTVSQTIKSLQTAGHTTFTALANELNARNIPTARGGKWYPMTVKNLIERLKQ